jgi:hypothetical protein
VKIRDVAAGLVMAVAFLVPLHSALPIPTFCILRPSNKRHSQFSEFFHFFFSGRSFLAEAENGWPFTGKDPRFSEGLCNG